MDTFVLANWFAYVPSTMHHPWIMAHHNGRLLPGAMISQNIQEPIMYGYPLAGIFWYVQLANFTHRIEWDGLNQAGERLGGQQVLFITAQAGTSSHGQMITVEFSGNIALTPVPDSEGRIPFVARTRAEDSLVAEPETIEFEWLGAAPEESVDWQITVHSMFPIGDSCKHAAEGDPVEIVQQTISDTLTGIITLDLRDEAWQSSGDESARALDGRCGHPLEVTFRAILDGEEEEKETIRQHQGDPHFDVLRQEYEDVSTNESGTAHAKWMPKPPSASGADDDYTIKSAEKVYPYSTAAFNAPEPATLPPQASSEMDYHIPAYLLHRDKLDDLEATYHSAMSPENKFEMNDNGWNFYVVTSSYRFPRRNDIPGGAPNSQHLYGNALDLQVQFRTWDDPIHEYEDLEPLEGKYEGDHARSLGHFVCIDTEASHLGLYDEGARIHVDWRGVPADAEEQEECIEFQTSSS